MPNPCVPLLLFLSTAALAQQALPEEVLALSRISRNTIERLERVGNFTCLETTERWSRPAPQHSLKLVDTVRVEVAHIGGRDLYSLPGAAFFEEKTPAALLGTGAGASGAFGAHLKAIFSSGGAVVRYSGEDRIGAQRVFRYDYQVPILFHQLNMHVASGSGAASIRGSFVADPATSDILRLDVEAADIPADLPVASFITRVEYGTVQLGSKRIWLPQRSDLRITYLSGRQENNRSEFTHCRQYVGESSLRFGEDLPPGGATAPRIAEISLPAGLTVPIQLENEIDSTKAAIGDVLAATVTADVSTRRAEIVIPKGAAVRCRLRLLHRGAEPVPHVVVGLEIVEIEFGGKRAAFYGRLVEPPAIAGPQGSLTGSTAVTTGFSDTDRETVPWQIRAPEVPGIGTFVVRGSSFRLPAGTRMAWRTADLRKTR